MDFSEVELSDLRKLSIEERRRLIRLIRESLDEDVRPDVPVEPHHRAAILEAQQRFRENIDSGRPVEEVVARILAKR